MPNPVPAPIDARTEPPAPQDAPITVVLADDRQLVRRALRRRLEVEHDVTVVAEAGDLVSAMRHVGGHVPNVLVLDLEMPNGSGIEAIRRLRAQVPETQIVVVTGDGGPAFAQQALDAGAIGYADRRAGSDELLAAVRAAGRGERHVSPRIAAALDSLLRGNRENGLSPRETEVLHLIALGYTNAEISDRLHLSKRTVESHRLRIHRKLGLSRRSELVRYAIDHDLIGD